MENSRELRYAARKVLRRNITWGFITIAFDRDSRLLAAF